MEYQSYQLRKELWESLKKIAIAQTIRTGNIITTSSLIREAIENYIEQNQKLIKGTEKLSKDLNE